MTTSAHSTKAKVMTENNTYHDVRDDYDVDDNRTDWSGTVAHETVYGSTEDLRLALGKPDSDPNMPWFTRFQGPGIPETADDYDPDGYNDIQVDTAVSLCFWEALGNRADKLQLLLDDPRTDATLAMASIARMREDIMQEDVAMLHQVEVWATSKGVDVKAVYASTKMNKTRTLFTIAPGEVASATTIPDGGVSASEPACASASAANPDPPHLPDEPWCNVCM